ncbi:MAG: hypothetical protein K2X47_04345, partial [Bdellovibrionales bacterium]|nr:hypothetical protein [Bdellovibrionales bacterium]
VVVVPALNCYLTILTPGPTLRGPTIRDVPNSKLRINLNEGFKEFISQPAEQRSDTWDNRNKGVGYMVDFRTSPVDGKVNWFEGKVVNYDDRETESASPKTVSIRIPGIAIDSEILVSLQETTIANVKNSFLSLRCVRAN